MSNNPYTAPTANLEVTPTPVAEAPPLWNPNAAGVFSFFFTPIFGSIILMKNWQALGEPERARRAKLWIYWTIGFYVLMGVLGGLLPDNLSQKLPERALGIGFLVAWYMLFCKEQQDIVAVRFGKSWPKRSWALPIVYAFGVALIVVVGVVVISWMVG